MASHLGLTRNRAACCFIGPRGLRTSFRRTSHFPISSSKSSILPTILTNDEVVYLDDSSLQVVCWTLHFAHLIGIAPSFLNSKTPAPTFFRGGKAYIVRRLLGCTPLRGSFGNDYVIGARSKDFGSPNAARIAVQLSAGKMIQYSIPWRSDFCDSIARSKG
jgi:hypothetical protein